MPIFSLPRLATVALASAAVGLCALASSTNAASPPSRVIEVSTAPVVLVLPPGTPGFIVVPAPASASASSFDEPMPPPEAPFARLHQILQQAFGGGQEDRLLAAAMRQMQDGSPMQGVMVTTVSNGRETCTREVRYGGNSSAPVNVRTFGNGCHSQAAPAATPEEAGPAPRPAVRTLRVERGRRAPIQVAQLDH